KHGIGYSFAAFMNNENGMENTEVYLREFDETQYFSRPSLQIALAVSVQERPLPWKLQTWDWLFVCCLYEQ
ncbi:hypothetical protein, partial [Chryseobacterium sp. CH1]|uniref:hypothetical protein n=1 Tax=Chryseobacterium sp. CH1 TaxID=713551 RepID=UPI001026A8BE